MVPLGTLLNVTETTGPDKVMHYNLYPSADVNAVPKPGFSGGQAMDLMQGLAAETLPQQFGYEWTEMALQQKLAGNSAVYIFPLCVLLVFLALAAQYESWTLPFAIILIVPMCLLAAIAGVYLRGMDNNILTQIGFVVLVGLACKNAILIVEYAKQLMDSGAERHEAAVEASRLRLRPILMTSFAFTMGVWPLYKMNDIGTRAESGPHIECGYGPSPPLRYGATGIGFQDLPSRKGPRPATLRGPLHIQCNGYGDPQHLGKLTSAVLSWPHVETNLPGDTEASSAGNNVSLAGCRILPRSGYRL